MRPASIFSIIQLSNSRVKIFEIIFENGASHSRYFSDELDAQDFCQKEEQMFDILLCI